MLPSKCDLRDHGCPGDRLAPAARGGTAGRWAVRGLAPSCTPSRSADLLRGGARPLAAEARAEARRRAQGGARRRSRAAPLGVAPACERSPEPQVPLPRTVDEAVVARPLDAPEGERDNAVARRRSRRARARAAERAAPAPDQTSARRQPASPKALAGRAAIASTPAVAHRRRASRRRSRRGCADVVGARPRPQAVRREAQDRRRRLGAQRARRRARPARDARARRARGTCAPSDVAGPARGRRRSPAPRQSFARARPSVSHGFRPICPCAASARSTPSAGARSSFLDVEARGRAADDQTRRAASNAAHPGITDFSHAGTVGIRRHAYQGRGPGTRPARSRARANGVAAPAVYGARSHQDACGPEAAGAARGEREALQPLPPAGHRAAHGRVRNVLVFPRKVLAPFASSKAARRS